jgi:fatty acid desaturase
MIGIAGEALSARAPPPWGEDDLSIRSILIFIVLVWIAFAILGAILHLFKWLLYIAVLATLAAVVLGLVGNRSGRAGRS